MIKFYCKRNILSASLLAVVMLINILMTQYPLVNILSFEASFINAILFSIVSGIYWLNEKNRKYKISSLLLFYLSLTFLPLIILSVSTLFCQNCPIDDGILFFSIITIPSIFVGAALAEFSTFISFRLRYTLFIFFWVIVLLGFLPELFFNPQIYFYNPIFGFYPGVIYDEAIEISSKLVIYRTGNLFISIFLIILLQKKNNFSKISQNIIISIVIIFYFILYPLKVYLEFSTNEARIIGEVGNVYENDSIKIIFPNSLNEREKNLLIFEHFNAIKEIEKELNTKFDKKITSIVFTSGAQKKYLFGSANADVAKPWLNQIYLNFDNYQNSLKHELAHLISSKYASGIFKISGGFNPAMLEGYAMAIENNYDDYDLHYLAFLAYKNYYTVSLKNLFQNFSFFSNVSSLSYIYSGSFIKYLSEKYNWSKINNVYNSLNFEEEFGIPIDSLETEYYNYLQKLPIENNPHKAKIYFGRLPLLKKYCARATARQLIKAQKLFIDEKYFNANILFEEIYNYSKSYSSLWGIIQCNFKNKRYNESINLIIKDSINFSNSAYSFPLKIMLADNYILSKQNKKAQEIYLKILNQNPHSNYFNNAFVKLKLLEKNAALCEKYILENNSRKEIIYKYLIEKPNDSAIQTYLSLLHFTEVDYQKEKNKFLELTENFKFSSDTYFDLCKFSYSFLDFETANHYANLALQNSRLERKEIIESFLTKIHFAQEYFNRNGYN